MHIGHTAPSQPRGVARVNPLAAAAQAPKRALGAATRAARLRGVPTRPAMHKGSVLTAKENDELVDWMVSCNLANIDISRCDENEALINVLKLRETSGRARVPYTTNA